MEPAGMFEVEAKFPLAGPEALRARLAAAGASPGPTMVQEDVFFTHPEQDMRQRGEALRLRRQGDDLELTWKGRRRSDQDGAKVRLEENVPVGADPTALLAGLGFRPVQRVVKRRTEHRLGDVTVTLDEVEGLGWFAEIKVLSEDVGSARGRVEETARMLGLEGAVEASYAELLARL